MKSAFSNGTSGARWRSSALALLAFFLAASLATARVASQDAVFADVLRQAKTAAAAPYQPSEMTLPEVLRKLNYDTYRNITFRRERDLWHGTESAFEVQFFHPGYLFQQPVVVHEVREGEVQPLPFGHRYFRYPDFPAARMGDETRLGFAGLRILYPLNAPKKLDEVISFLGSSYFRALGRGQTYGISARGLALDTAENLPEEFPLFREFWLCRPEAGAKTMQLFALLDSPSVSGAYRFQIDPGADTTVAVEAHLFFRQTVEVLGLAPLTSMFWRGEEERQRPPDDRRPEVHDSDGLEIEDAAGATTWHPLRSVDKVTTQLFPESSPKSFSLLQRDREASHYRDREAHYEKRPSVRVESLGEWGPGQVRLLQLPTTNEYNDNVVAFWQPAKSPAAGDEIRFKYRLHWFSQDSNK